MAPTLLSLTQMTRLPTGGHCRPCHAPGSSARHRSTANVAAAPARIGNAPARALLEGRPEDSGPRTTPVRVITFGTFDLFHVGHLNLLRRARAQGDRLIVGVSSDELNQRKKGKTPVMVLDDRLAIVAGIRFVDEVFVEDSLELKGDYIRDHRADVLVMGDDWRGRFDQYSSLCRVVYLPRTPDVSSSGIVSALRAAS